MTDEIQQLSQLVNELKNKLGNLTDNMEQDIWEIKLIFARIAQIHPKFERMVNDSARMNKLVKD